LARSAFFLEESRSFAHALNLVNTNLHTQQPTATMFAVKGWAVDSSALKPQTKPIKSSKAQDALDRKAAKHEEANDGPNAEQKAEKANLKRKREEIAAANEPDLGKQWDKHVEGKDVSKPKEKKKKEGKKQKRDEQSADGVKPAEKKADAPATGGAEKAQSGSKKEKKKGKQDKGDKADAPAQDGAAKTTAAVVATIPPKVPALPVKAKLTPMQAAMRQKLISARFRHLNETLYTAPSADALQLFDANPEMFEDYHAGFRQQVEVWPQNPVDNFVATIRARGKVKQSYLNKKGSKSKPAKGAEADGALEPLPRTHGTAIIADLGCGDAALAHSLTTTNEISSLNLQLHSFDLHSPSKLVTKADISNLPLEDGSADVAIFCLALMGTNWISFIEEAYRILHWRGELWVAEIKSRFGRVDKKKKVVEHSVGSKRKAKMLAPKLAAKKKEQDEAHEEQTLATEVDGVEAQQQPATDVSGFIEVLRRRGFVLKDGDNSVDLSNKMFVKMEFTKSAAPVKGKGVAEIPEDHRKPKPTNFQSKRFIEEQEKNDDVPTDDESKALKPCLYKIR
jgi:ribosomal RNA-processing protein 8